MSLRFGSVCSGIEAASVAWGPLGWHAAWVAEIEPFPCAVLAHHYPDVPNLGDMTTIATRIAGGEVEAPDLLCGGTPCQAFSVAGLRNSLDDARGNLSLVFCQLADAVDSARSFQGLDPAIIFWENVPGVLSTKDHAFGCFLAGLAGEDYPLVAPGGKWSNAGYVLGPKRTVAWRVLDAQYFGVAQRRRRVFVVASARADFDPTEVLFEREGLRRDIAPSRQARQGTAGGVEIGPSGGRLVDLNPTLDTRAKDGPIRNQLAGAVIQPFEVANCLTARMHKGINSTVDEGQTPVVAMRESGPGYWVQDSISDTLRTDSNRPGKEDTVVGMQAVCGTIDASEDGTGRGTPLVPVCHVDTMPTLRAGALNSGAGHGARSGDSKDEYIIPVRPMTLALRGRDGVLTLETRQDGTASAEDLSPSMGAKNPMAVAIGWSEQLTASIDLAGTIQRGGQGGRHDGVMQSNMQVRRLTPVECERLQGFPDGYTAIPWRKKPADQCPDGPRYKALGNSWAVPNVRWIGERIKVAL